MSKKNKKNPNLEIPTITYSWSKWFPYLLGLITFFVYLNSIQNGYNLDDELVTRNHPLTSKGLSAIWEIITSPYYSDDMGYSYGYRPMVLLSFAIENYFFGESPHVGHFINLLIYMSIVVLAFKFLIKLFGIDYQYIAFFAMLIFAVHPVHTEVVNSLKNRDELLGLFFALISLSFLVKQNFNEKKYLWFLLFCIFLIFSILSKKSSIPIFFCAPLFFVNNDKIETLHYFTFSIILNFLVATFGSDFNTILSVKLFLIGGVFSISFFVLKNRTIWLKIIPESVKIKNSYSLLLIISFLLLFIFSIFYKSNEVLIVAYVVLATFIFLEKSKKELVSFFVIFSMFFASLFFRITVLSDISAMLCVFFLFYRIKKNKEIKLHYSYLIWLIPILFNFNGFLNFQQFVGYMIQLIVLILVYKYKWIKYLLLIGFVVFFTMISQIDLEALLFIVILFFDKFKFLKKTNVSYYQFVLFGIITFLVLINFNNQKLDLAKASKKTEISKIQSKSNISEGRELNFVENPLVNSNDDQRKLIVGFETVGQYIKLLIIPYPLKFYYGFNVVNIDSKLSVSSIFGLLFLSGFIFLVFYFAKNRNYNILFFVFSSLLSLAMFSNWFVLVAGIIGERLVFEASFSFIFVLVYLFYFSKFISDLFKKVSLFIIAIIFSALTFSRNQDWKDPLTLMGNDIKHLQYSAQANNLYALNLMKICSEETSFSADQMLSMQKLAKKHLKRAVKIYPKFSNAWYDLSRVSLILRDTSNAVKALNRTILLNKKFPDAYVDILGIFEFKDDRLNHLKYSRLYFKNINDPEAIIMMAKSYVANQKIDSAQVILKKGLKTHKNNERILSNLSEIKFYIKNNKQ